jgi:hypothetical protein
VQTEVAIHQASSVIALGWEPAVDTRPTQLSNDGKLKGTYLLTVKKPDGTILNDVAAASDWVEANFKPEVLAVVQRAVFQALTRVEVISHDGVKKRVNKRGYVSVEDNNNVVKIENDAITGLKYYQPKNVGG